ncbi:MAG TPA: HAMP domain-containing protein, partial [Spirochaetes bacterium]|nr:HAMP domain-containing protein [Spirochaetota bacterium]
MRNLLQIRINMLQEYLALQDGNMAEVDKRLRDSEKLTDEYREDWKQYKATLFSEEGKQLAREWEELMKAPAEVRGKYREALLAKDMERAKVLLAQWADGYRLLRAKTDVLIDSKNKFALEDRDHTIAASRQGLRVNIAILVISIIIAIIITTVLARAISAPVAKGLAFARKLAEGDFTGRIDLDQKDELGELGRALNIAADDLEKLVSEITVAAQNLNQAVDEIASGNQNLSQRTSEQASSLEEIASTIEEATAAIRQNAENADQANRLSDETTRLAEDGNKVVIEAVDSINEISKSSKKIEEIISVINEIAFQTNLLALNAAVEAARAGEQGRGFAVVAGEVRNLAQRSANAAREIGALIKESVNTIGVGTDKANRSGEALKEIVNSMKNVARLISEIAAASQEQKQGIDQINVAVTEMDNMTQQNAALVEETASASEEMAGQARELRLMMEKFKVSDSVGKGVYSSKRREIQLKTAGGARAGRK